MTQGKKKIGIADTNKLIENYGNNIALRIQNILSIKID